MHEKVKVLDLIRREKISYAKVAKIPSKSKFSICEIVKKKKKLKVVLLLHLKLKK